MTPEQIKQYLHAWASSTWLVDRVPKWVTEPADREDIAHKVWCKFATLDPARIKDASKFEGFVKRALRNAAIDLVRRQAIHEEFTEECLERAVDLDSEPLSPEQEYERQQRKALARRAMLQLPRERRNYFYLAKVEGFTVEAIAWRLGKSPKTVKKELALAVLRFEEELWKLLGEGGPGRHVP